MLSVTSCREAECGAPGEAANVAGEWTLSAQGKREACGDEALDTDVRLRIHQPLTIEQTLSYGTGGESLQLSSAPEVPDGTFSFTGRVEGGCVEFTTRERGADYELRFSFVGKVRGNRIRGSFTESTPFACPSSGDFQVDISPTGGLRDAGPGEPLHNPDGSVRLTREDGGCFFADAGSVTGDGGWESFPTLDGGLNLTSAAADAGVQWVCTTRTRSEVEYVYPCHRTYDCAQGVCADGACAVGCRASADCSVGESCIDLRCEPAPGCGCTGVTGAALWPFALVLFVLGAAMRRSSVRYGRNTPPMLPGSTAGPRLNESHRSARSAAAPKSVRKRTRSE